MERAVAAHWELVRSVARCTNIMGSHLHSAIELRGTELPPTQHIVGTLSVAAREGFPFCDTC